MLRQSVLLAFALIIVVGCAPSPEQEFDRAIRALERAQTQLDRLRPAYDAAREKAMLEVCKELTGTTPEESAMAALSQLEGLADQALTGLPTDGQPTEDAEATDKPVGDADAALDQLLAAHQSIREQQQAMANPIAKTRETIVKIQMPDTPEAKRFEEVFNEMPAVKAYRRQEERLERAQQKLADAEAALPDSDAD